MDLSYEVTGVLTFTLAGAYVVCCIVFTRNLNTASHVLDIHSPRPKTELEEIFGL